MIILRKFHSQTSVSFGLQGTALVHLNGVGGRTIKKKIHLHDLHVIRELRPDIVILEVGTNDLSFLPPEVVGQLVVTLKTVYSVLVVCVCHVIPRGLSTPHLFSFLKL